MKIKKKVNSENLIGFLLSVPALIVFGFIILYPFLTAVYYSFTNKHFIKLKHEWVGFKNYIDLFNSSDFSELLSSSFIFVVFATLVPFIFGFLWAIVMNTKFRGSNFFRGLTLVNWIIPGIAIGFLWTWIFDTNYGLLNGILNQKTNWMGQTSTAMLTVILARTWQMFPWHMAFLLGGLQSVSMDEVEAARMDGASNLGVFRHVVYPTVKPIASLILVLATINNLQHFDIIQVMTKGTQMTETFAVYVYNTAFKEYEIGEAAAVGVIWAIVLGLFSIVYIRRVTREE